MIIIIMIIDMKWMIIMDNDSYDSWMIITIIMIIITQNMFMKIYIYNHYYDEHYEMNILYSSKYDRVFMK